MAILQGGPFFPDYESEYHILVTNVKKERQEAAGCLIFFANSTEILCALFVLCVLWRLNLWKQIKGLAAKGAKTKARKDRKENQTDPLPFNM